VTSHVERPQPSDPGVSVRMRAQAEHDTRPEVALRRLLHAAGLRYRLHRPVPGTRREIDIAFVGPRLAVFVDGCFWHGCPDHGSVPRANAEWWAAKLAANCDRDRDTTRRLTESGWRVLRIWEHETAVAAATHVFAAIDHPDVDTVQLRDEH
jgi:DNA mismatch endonuclease, patch repair protein